MSSSNNDLPPQPNPVLTAYDSFYQSTPYVTRIILSVQVVSYALSWIVDPMFALGNIPLFSIQKLEIYRLILSPIVNNSFISLIFAFWSFQPLGQRLESSMGSTAFCWLCFMLGFLTNVVFVVVSYFLRALTGNRTYILANSYSIWIVLFGTIALECVRAPLGTSRPFFFGSQVPVRYYPLVLYLAFGLLSMNFSLAYLISIGLGYLVGFGDAVLEDNPSAVYLRTIAGTCERLVLLPAPTAQQWEERYWSELTRKQGWIGGNACFGSAAWSAENMASSGGMSLPLFRQQAPSGSNENIDGSFTGAGSVFREGRQATASGERSSNSSSIPAESTGRTLGGSTTRRSGSAVDTRAARLQAIERQQQPQP